MLSTNGKLLPQLQGSAAIDSDVSGPGPIVDFPKSGKHRGSTIPVHRQDRGEVLAEQNPKITNGLKQSSARTFRLIP